MTKTELMCLLITRKISAQSEFDALAPIEDSVTRAQYLLAKITCLQVDIRGLDKAIEQEGRS